MDYPVLGYRKETVEREKVCGLIGAKLTSKKIAELLSKMCLESTAKDGNCIIIVIQFIYIGVNNKVSFLIQELVKR